MMDKRSEKLSEQAKAKSDQVAQLQRQLVEAKKQESKKKRALHTHQVCEIGGTTRKYLIDADLLTKEDLEGLLDYAFSKPDVQARLKNILRSHGWVDEATEPVGSSAGLDADQYGGRTLLVYQDC